MKRLLLLCVSICSVVPLNNSCLVQAREPFLRFVDDLCIFSGGDCDRDPYEERIETERHDFTQSTTTVGPGVLQVEGGYSYFYKEEHGEVENTHVFPEGLIRYGVSDDIEFRLRWNYAWRFSEEEEDREGGTDMLASCKLRTTEQERFIPESALEIRTLLPTGGSAWTLEKFEVGLDYIYGWHLGEYAELYGSTGYFPSGLGDPSLVPSVEIDEDFGFFSQSVALGLELTDKSVLYNEWFGLFLTGLEDREATVSFYNFGVDYYLSDNFVLDFRAGWGLTNESDDFFTGIGGGYRF